MPFCSIADDEVRYAANVTAGYIAICSSSRVVYELENSIMLDAMRYDPCVHSISVISFNLKVMRDRSATYPVSYCFEVFSTYCLDDATDVNNVVVMVLGPVLVLVGIGEI